MYYKVSVYKESNNVKEMIVKAHSSEDVEKQIDRAKQYLYPTENTENYLYQISEFSVSESKATSKYYKISVFKPFDNNSENCDDASDFCYSDYIEKAENHEQVFDMAKKELFNNGENPADYEIKVKEVSVEYCIDQEINNITKYIVEKYLKENYNSEKLNIREYSKIKESLTDNKENLYKILSEYSKLLRTKKYLNRIESVQNLTVKDYNDFLKRLVKSDNEEEFNDIIREIKNLTDQI